MHSAAANGNTGLVQYALAHGQPVNSILAGVLPLHAAASSGNETVVRMLIEAGADVNRSTPLHFAAANGHLSILRLLLSYGADPRLPEKGGITPEQIAVSNGHLDAAELLRGWADVLDAHQGQPGGKEGKGGSTRSLSLRLPSATTAPPPSSRNRSLSSAASVLHPQRSFDRLATKLVQSAQTAQHSVPIFNHVRGLTSSTSSLSSAVGPYATPSSASTSQISLGAVGGPLGIQVQGANGSSWSVASSAGGAATGASTAGPSTRRLSFTSLRSGNGGDGGAAENSAATPRTRRPSLPSVWEKAGRPGAAIRHALGMSAAASSTAAAGPSTSVIDDDAHLSADELSEQDRTERAERRRSLEVHRPLRQDSFVGSLAVQPESRAVDDDNDDEGEGEVQTPVATRAPEVPVPSQPPLASTATIGPLTRAASHHFYRPRQSSNLSKGSFSGRRPSLDDEGVADAAERDKEGQLNAGVFEDEPRPPLTPISSPNRRRALSNPNPQSGSRSPLLQQVHFNQHQQLQMHGKEDGMAALPSRPPNAGTSAGADVEDGDEEDDVGMLRPTQAHPTFDARRAFAPVSSAGNGSIPATQDTTARARDRSNSASTRFSSSPGSTYSGPTFSTYAPSASTAPTSVAPSSPGTKAKTRIERAHEGSATPTPALTSQRLLVPLYESRAVHPASSLGPPKTREHDDEDDKPKTRAQARSRVQKAERELLGFGTLPAPLSATEVKSAGSGKSLKDQLAAYGRSLKAERELVEREEREKAKARSAGYTIQTISTSAKAPAPAPAQQQPTPSASPAIPAWRAIPHVDRLVPPSPGRRSVSPGASSATPRRRPSRDLDSSNPSSAKTTPPKSSITERRRASSPTSTRSGSNKSSSTTMAGGAAVLGSGPGGVSFVEVQPARSDGHHHHHHHHHHSNQTRATRSDKSHSDGRGGGATSTLSSATTAAGKISIRDQVEVDRRIKDELEQRVPKAARTAPHKGLKRFFGGGGSGAASRS
ncbi:ankyrin repeat protein [Rhodotorula toruloides]|uniref:Ankyrin repeat protein n=1 Tax=Rhodotorula toruloides TaxID=5286 RepID=A0A511KJ04_RHOTO|nr:ankyrin repeat protein [Rhodotorula toruloides]